jgi:hypothetical protein
MAVTTAHHGDGLLHHPIPFFSKILHRFNNPNIVLNYEIKIFQSSSAKAGFGSTFLAS